MTGQESDLGRVFRKIEKMENLSRLYRNRRRIKRLKDEKKRGAGFFLKSNFSKAKCMTKWLLRKYIPRNSGQEGTLELDRQRAAERKRLYFRKERIVVYTALFGHYDTIREPLLCPDNIDYYLLTDRPVAENSLWKLCSRSNLLPQEILEDPVLCNRWCKMHPHILFPEYDYSIYVDANIWVISDLTPVTAWLDRCPVAMFHHKKRNCVYDEVQACIDLKKADEDSLRRHGELIRSHGIPPHWGLLEASIIARKHSDPRCVTLMEDWWNSFLQNSRRDQISLIDVLWQSGIRPDQIGTLGYNLQRCDLFIQMEHDVSGEPEQPETLEDLQAQ